MKASQYKAIREAGVVDFAIFPADVEAKLPWSIDHANKAESVRACPTGLVQATILKDDVEWREAFTLGCGDTEYQRRRRNGVAVEVALDDFREATKLSNKAIGQMPRTKVKRRGDQRFVEIVVSKQAIMAPWGEYALIEAEREKSREEEIARNERLDAAVKKVGAERGRFIEVTGEWDTGKDRRLPPESYDYLASLAWRGTERGAYLQGEIILSLERAEEIAALLATTGVAP